MTVAIEIDSVDVTTSVIWNTLLVQKSAEQLNSVAGFQIRNVAVVSGQDVYIYDDTWDIFRGTVATCQVSTQTTTETVLDVACVDLNDMLDKRVCTTAITSIVNSDADFIDWLFTEYLPSVDSETYVKELTVDMSGMALEPNTLRAILNQVCSITGAYYYIDAQARLHYFDSEAEAAPFGLSDEPDYFTTFSYLDDPVKVEDGSRTLAGVFVVGSGIKGWRGSHGATDPQAIVYDKKVSSLGALEKRGDQVLNVYGAAKVSYQVRTLVAGLEVGQDIPFKCDLYGVNDTFTIRAMDVTWEDGFVVYSLTLGDPVNPAVEGGRTWQEIIPQAIGPIYPPQLPTSSLGWAHDLVFSATDHNTVAWTAGTITLADGTSYSIDAGNTGNMAAATYVYLDLDTSTTALQKVTVSSTAVGAKKVLVAVAYPSAVGYDATFMVYGQPGNQLVDTENILAGAVDTDQLAALAVTGAKIEALTIVGGHIAAATITGAKIAAATIEGGNIKANTITAANIAANTITSNEIAANTIVAGNIASGAITADKIAAGAIVGTKFSNLIGGLLFDQLNGLLLLGPHAALTPTSWTSSRGQVATIAGAFHTEQGAWTGTRGLVVERGTVNMVTNPSAAVNVTDYWSFTSGTRARDTTYYKFDGASFALTGNGTAGGPYLYKANAVVNPVQGRVYSLSAWFLGTAETEGTTAYVAIQERGGAAPTAVTYTYHTLTRGWQWVTVTRTVAEADRTSLLLVVRSTDSVNGHTTYIDGIQFELGNPTSTCIGSMAHCTWGAGTPHVDAVSNREGNIVSVPLPGTINAAAGSIVVNFKQLTWSYVGGFLFRAGNANAEFDAFINSAGTLIYRINGSNRLTTTNVAAGQEHQVVFTWDVATDTSQMYLDGVQVGGGNGTCGGGAWTPDTVMYIGGIAASGYALGGTVSQFATLGRVLTADEVAAMYALQRPLVDAGAVDVPGIYLYDGRFRLASRATGARTEIDVDGIKAYSASAQSVAIETDGDVKLGSNIGTTAGTALAVFATAQTYNSEGMGAGDVLFGDNSAGKANMKWDASEGKLLFRSGTTTHTYINTDGSFSAAGGIIKLNAGGMTIDTTTAYATTRAIRFLTSTTTMASLRAYRNAGDVRVLNMTLVGDGGSAGEDSNILIDSWALAGNNNAQVELKAYDGQGGLPYLGVYAYYNSTFSIELGHAGNAYLKVNQAAVTLAKPLSLNQLTNDPSSMPDGTMYYNTSLKCLSVKINGSWKAVAVL